MVWTLQSSQSDENDNSLPGCAQYGYSIPIIFDHITTRLTSVDGYLLLLRQF